MSCDCNGNLQEDKYYQEYRKKHEVLLKECIAELLDERCQADTPEANRRKRGAKMSSCEITIHHSGTLALLRVIQPMEAQGCNKSEIKEAVLERLDELQEFKDLLKDITE